MFTARFKTIINQYAEQELEQGPDHLIWEATFAMWCIGIFGLFLNAASILFVLKFKSAQNVFTMLYLSIVAADCGVLLMFSGWAAQTFVVSGGLFDSIIARTAAGYFTFSFLVISELSTLSVAVNRVVAVRFHHLYGELYTHANVRKLICATCALASVLCIPFAVPDCGFQFDARVYGWHFAETRCGFGLSIVCACVCLGVFALIFCLNVVTINDLRKQSKKIAPQFNEAQRARRRNQEIRFMVQACLNAVMFELAMLFFHVIYRVGSTPWQILSLRTLVWQSAHASSGLIFLACDVIAYTKVTEACRAVKRLSIPSNQIAPELEPVYFAGER